MVIAMSVVACNKTGGNTTPSNSGLNGPGTAAAISDEVTMALAAGKSCEATWGAESSRQGQTTGVYGTRMMVPASGGPAQKQHQVDHPEMGKIWTWHWRLGQVICR